MNVKEGQWDVIFSKIESISAEFYIYIAQNLQYHYHG